MARDDILEKNDNQFTKSLHELYEMTARIDERLKSVSEKQIEFENKIEKYSGLSERLVGLESSGIKSDVEKIKSDIQSLEKMMHGFDVILNNIKFQTKSHENRWQKTLDIIVQIGVVVAAALVIYRLGLEI